MNVRVIVSQLCMFLCVVSAQGQDFYREAVKQYVIANPYALNSVNLNKIFGGLNSSAQLGLSMQEMQSLLERYRNTQLVEDMIDYAIVPLLVEKVTISDLHTLTSLFQTPEGKEWQKQNSQLQIRLKEQPQELMDFIQNNIKLEKRGEPLQDAVKRKDIPADYAKLFYQSVDTSEASGLKSYLVDLLSLSTKNDDAKSTSNVIRHFVKNHPTIMLNYSYGIMTKEGLVFQKKLNNTQAQQHLTESMKGYVGRIVQKFPKWQASYERWLLSQKDMCEFLLQKAADYIKVSNTDKSEMQYELKLGPQSLVFDFIIMNAEDAKQAQKEIQNVDLRDTLVDKFFGKNEKSRFLTQLIANSGRNVNFNLKDHDGNELGGITITNQEICQFEKNYEAYQQELDYADAVVAFAKACPSIMLYLPKNTCVAFTNSIYQSELKGFDEYLRQYHPGSLLEDNKEQNRQKVLVRKYVNEQMDADFAKNILVPYFKDVVTIDNLYVLTSLMQSPDGRQYQDHLGRTIMRMRANMNSLLKDNYTPRLNPQIPQDYIERFPQIVDKDMLFSVFSSFKSEDMDFVRGNQNTVAVNSSFLVLDKQDISFKEQLIKAVEYNHVHDAIAQLLKVKNDKGATPLYTQSLKDWAASYREWLYRQEHVSEFLFRQFADTINAFISSNADMSGNLGVDAEKHLIDIVIADDKYVENRFVVDVYGKEALLDDLKYTLTTFFDNPPINYLANIGCGLIIRFKAETAGQSLELKLDSQEVKSLSEDMKMLNVVQQGIGFYDEQKYDQALPLLKQGADAGIPMAQYRLSEIYLDSDIDESIKLLEMVSKQTGNKKLRNLALTDLSRCYTNAKQTDKGLAYADQAIKEFPDVADNYLCKGEALYMKKDKKDAKAMWEKAISLDPTIASDHECALYQMLFGKGKNK